MPEPVKAPQRFHMTGVRAALLAGPSVESIVQQIEALEESLEHVPDFAFDLSKTLVETVCKTVLEDLGQTIDPNWDCPRLLKETTNRLSFLPVDCPEPAKSREAIEKIMRGFLQSIQGLCELRNRFGIASHGRDAFAARMGNQQATLAAQSADTIVSFLYRVHRDASQQTPGPRIHYEDHVDFNAWFDATNEVIELGKLREDASRALFRLDSEAYRDELLLFIAGSSKNESPDFSAGSMVDPTTASSSDSPDPVRTLTPNSAPDSAPQSLVVEGGSA